MNEIFVDTLYFAARLNPRDQWHESALITGANLGNVQLVTTETILHELLNFFAEFSPPMRKRITIFVNRICAGGEIEIIPHTQKAFLDGLRLYESRLDKGYSLTDCISMNAMQQRGITEVLSHDNHFTQEGYTVLL